MLKPEPILIEYRYKNDAYLAWASICLTEASEYLVETLTPFRQNKLKLNLNAQWEEDGIVTPLTQAIGRAIEALG